MKNILKMAIASLLVAGSTQLVTADEIVDLYKSKCATCHTAGVAGAPIFGNKEQWAPRIAKGMDVLMDTALNGSKTNPAMMPKGGFADLTDGQIKALVDHMVNSSK